MGRHLRDPPRPRPTYATDDLAGRRRPAMPGPRSSSRTAAPTSSSSSSRTSPLAAGSRSGSALPGLADPQQRRRPAPSTATPAQPASVDAVPAGGVIKRDSDPGPKGTIHVALSRDHSRRGPLAPRSAREARVQRRGICRVRARPAPSRRHPRRLHPRHQRRLRRGRRHPLRDRRAGHRGPRGATASTHSRSNCCSTCSTRPGRKTSPDVRRERRPPARRTQHTAAPAPRPATPRRRRKPQHPGDHDASTNVASLESRSAGTAIQRSCGAFRRCAPRTRG